MTHNSEILKKLIREVFQSISGKIFIPFWQEKDKTLNMWNADILNKTILLERTLFYYCVILAFVIQYRLYQI